MQLLSIARPQGTEQRFPPLHISIFPPKNSPFGVSSLVPRLSLRTDVLKNEETYISDNVARFGARNPILCTRLGHPRRLVIHRLGMRSGKRCRK